MVNNNYNNFTDKEFNDKYMELITRGFSPNSPEVISLLKARAEHKINGKSENSSSNLSDEYSNLIAKGYSLDSPEVIEFFQKSVRTRQNPKYNNISRSTSKTQNQKNPQLKNLSSTQPRTRQKPTSNYSPSSPRFSNPHKYNYTKQIYDTTMEPNTDSKLKPFHFVIDTFSGDYTLLDSKLNIIDIAHCNPFLKLFTRKHNLRKFKKQLNQDLKNYKKSCKYNNIKPNKNFIRTNKNIKFYLWLCPDADYNILELLRRNVAKLNCSYKNYQFACEKYLHELANLQDGDPSVLPFDINIATIDGLCSNSHSYISNIFKRSGATIQDFIDSYHRYNDELDSSSRQYKSHSYTYSASHFKENSNYKSNSNDLHEYR